MAIEDNPGWLTIMLGKLGHGLHSQSGADRNEPSRLMRREAQSRRVSGSVITISERDGHKYYGEVIE